ncbi:hypothetical protein IC757_02680 [Wenzhouxiangella sp. AB-CW3]|uniref:hypothetical protein n=1 Tax=Wenzhouxiangella sp. AB-CW3 TaxID=2771012 RepID=UPI00168B936B|nr:hypothetical protein [Wenzhouxiangella sp. AB-CW3]QOC23084.1 hypothetical protein IC757_02680 [Wenzhouxiangella sp. AB-CW3]
MIIATAFWKRPIVMLLLIALAIGGGIWLALDRPLPAGWGEEETRPEIRLPEFLRQDNGRRSDQIYCAESVETGVCRCIRGDGSRPDISEEECRRRARGSITTAED